MAPETSRSRNPRVPHLRSALAQMWTRSLAFLADFALLSYLLIMSSFVVSRMAATPSVFSVLPWWGLALIVFELCLVWETFALSPGLRLLGIELIGDDLGWQQRLLRLAASNLAAISVMGLLVPLWDKRSRSLPELLSCTAFKRRPPQTETRTSWYRTSSGWALIVLVVVTLVGGVYLTEINLDRFSWSAAVKMLRRLFRPDWAGELGNGLSLLKETIFMALMATLFAIPIAFSLSFLAARNLATGPIRRSVYTVLRVLLSILRSIEPIVWAIIFLIIVEPRRAPFAGVLALWVHSISDLTKLYSERLESIDPGPVEAITATGASRLQIILYGIVPQILNPYLSFTLYRWDINVRMATIIGLVGGGGIGQMLYQYIRLHYWERAAVLIVLIIITVWAMDYTSSKLRERFEHGGLGGISTELIRFPGSPS